MYYDADSKQRLNTLKKNIKEDMYFHSLQFIAKVENLKKEKRKKEKEKTIKIIKKDTFPVSIHTNYSRDWTLFSKVAIKMDVYFRSSFHGKDWTLICLFLLLLLY